MSKEDTVNQIITASLPFVSLIPGAGPFIPLVLSAVHSVEALFGAGNGAKKKEAVMAMAGDAINIYNTARGANFNNSEIMAGISKIVDGAVQISNAVGAFQISKK